MGIRSRIREHLLNIMALRAPDFIIGGHDNPYLLRWYLTPWSGLYRDIPDEEKTLWQRFVRNGLPNVYLHRFLRSDDDRALHDHPWYFNASFMLEGEYTEHTIAEGGVHTATVRKAGERKFRWGPAPHRVELHAGQCVTLFVTGPVAREWGFHCPAGWIPWKRFVSSRDKGEVGAGCAG